MNKLTQTMKTQTCKKMMKIIQAISREKEFSSKRLKAKRTKATISTPND